MTNRTGALRSNDSTPARRLAVGQPQLSAADQAAHVAASYVRRQQAIAHSLQAADLFDEAGEPAYTAASRADADRMRRELVA
ncbi:hypothetical protein GT352_28085 [Streptomyces sp. SID1046]|uniref:hypothetical protein n=1 Tax=Streptomyces sp. SID1046 TaxID=2690249 RepID=UPI00136ADADF|nr:hypothetical protein [Streptomyces sp. SID1046]MYV77761.1 hypothetical protein [Streptomyces sp. SID1046]